MRRKSFKRAESPVMEQLQDVTLDLCATQARLLRAECCSGRSMVVAMKQIALNDLRNAARRIDALQRAIEDGLFQR